MFKNISTTAWLIIVTVILTIATACGLKEFGKYQPYSSFFATDSHGKHSYAATLDHVELRGRLLGQPAWKARAKSISLTFDESRCEATDIHDGIIYTKNAAPVRFSSDSASFIRGAADDSDGELSLSGHVRASFKEKKATSWSAEGDRLVWNKGSDTVTSPHAVQVRITTPQAKSDIVLTAASFSWLKPMETLKFDGAAQARNVTAQGRIEGTPAPVAMNASSIKWNGAQKSLTATGTVETQFTLPKTTTKVNLNSTIITWETESGRIIAPTATRANISSLGDLNCASVSFDLKTKAFDLTSAHLAACGETVKTTVKAEKSDKDRDRVYMDSPDGKWHRDDQNDTWVTNGKITFRQDDATLTTVGAFYDGKANTAKALSPVVVSDSESTLTGKDGKIDFNKKIVTITGSVHLVETPKDDQSSKKTDNSDKSIASVQNEPTDITCDSLVYNYKTKIAVITGNIVITQKKRVVTADKGTYDAGKKIAELNGSVVEKKSDGSIGHADKAKVSLKKGDEWADLIGKVSYEFTPSDDDNPRPK